MNKRRVELLEALYARIPAIKCQGKCASACGPIDMSALERARIRKKTHVTLTSDYARAFVALSETERLLHIAPDCPLLKNGRCSAYEVRPLICRLWGVTREMVCNYGCVPERYLTFPEQLELFEEVQKVGGVSDG